MKTFLLGLLCLVFSVAQAQEVSTFPNMPMTDFGEFDVVGDRIVALGTCDQIWFSLDAGSTWSYREAGYVFFDIRFIPNDPNNRVLLTGEIVAVFDFEEGIVQDFYEESLFQESNFYRNIEVSNDHVYVIGNDQVIAAPISNFAWTEIYRDTFEQDYIYTTELVEDQLFLGGRNGKLVKLNVDNGEWSLQQDLGNWIFHISMGSENVGYVTASGISDVLKTSDGWNSYEELTELPENIQPIAYGEDVVITVNTNRIYLSTDGGQSATYIETANTPEFSLTYRGLFDDNGDLYFAGRGAMMTKSTDYGMTWTPLNPYNRSNLQSTDADEEGNVIVVGENQTIYTSSDNGQNWVEEDLNFTTDSYLSEVLILAPNKYLIASGDHIMTFENNEVMHSVELRADRIIQDNDENYLVAMVYNDGNYEIHKSEDEGMTWVKKFELEDYGYVLTQNNSGKLYTGIRTQIYSSIDHGETWQEENFDLEPMFAAAFWDDNIGVVVSSNKLNITKDGGQTFEEVGSGYAIRNITFLSEDKFFYTTASNNHTNLRMTEDGGETFSTFYVNCATTADISINSENEMILAQRDGHIQVVPLGEDVTPSALNEIPNINVNISPNPASKFDAISIDGDWSQVSIYNISGGLIYAQNDNAQHIDISNLVSGVYFVQVSTEKGIAVEKLVVQ